MLLGCDKSLDYQGAIRLKQKVPEFRLSFILKMIFLEQYFRSVSRLEILIACGEFCSSAQLM